MVASVKNIPSRETIEAIIDSIRAQGKAHSDEAADMVAFLAFAGCRLSQARAVRWEDVGETWLTFAGGIEGAKGARLRKLPISGPLRAILDRMRPKVEQGPIFSLVRPHEALSNACKRLGIPHVRIHDLRHFFATHALQSGVDVQTVSKWLGHKDGGVLVLRTYGHVRDDHSLEQAGKLL
jgi:integrase